MDYVIGFLMVVEALVCLLLILIILMQRPRQDGLGAAFGSGMTDQMFGAQTTNVLQKGTTWLGIALFVLSFLLAVLVSRRDSQRTLPKLVDESDKKAVPTLPVTTTPPPAVVPPVAPETPDAGTTTPAKPSAEAPKSEPSKPEIKPGASTPAAPVPAPVQPTTTPPASGGTLAPPVPGVVPTPPPVPSTGN